MDLLKCTEQNVNNQTLSQVSQLYVHVSCCLKVIRSLLNLPTNGHGHVICMGDEYSNLYILKEQIWSSLAYFCPNPEVLGEDMLHYCLS